VRFLSLSSNALISCTVPIAASPADTGLAYEINPRYTPDGVWQPRKRWPKDLQ
jgi:hypothetical protein